MRKTLLATAVGAVLSLSACSDNTAPTQQANQAAPAATAEVTVTNPFFKKSTLPFEAPNFAEIKDDHFLPAFEEGMKQHMAEIEAIANNPEPATFENTFVAMEKSGELLTRVSRVFYNLTGTDSNEQRRQIQSELAPKMAAHSDNINLNPTLFARVESVYNARNDLGLDAESLRLVEVYYERFVRSGAKLNDEQKTAIRALNEEHSKLTNQFSQNLLAETRNIAVVVDTVEELDGLSPAQITSAANAAKERGLEGKYLLSITNTTRQPILTSLNNREVRQRVWEASANRAQSGEFNNTEIVSRLAQLRAERAKLLGYDNWAAYTLENNMAQNPKAVFDMLGSMVPAVVENTLKEQEAIQAMIREKGGDFDVQPWDWEYYAEFVRQAKYDLDENEVKKYFEFNRVLKDGAFYYLNRFYGVRFEPRPDLPVYHPDVEVYEVFDADGTSIALFYADYFAREGKRGGAWMSSFVGQSHLTGQKPVVVNVMNIPKAPDGEPTLISYDHTTTIFHELGHGVHGMFSSVKYPSLAMTAVSRDFVEFPSTFEEDWAQHPEILANYAKHYQTGEPIPADLLDKVMRSRSFNQGFDTLEYISAALLDMEWHTLGADAPLQNPQQFEAAALKKHGVDLAAVPPRYKSNFFSHSMGGGYSAGYYAYMWSEILAADAFAHVQKNGGLTRENGDHYRKNILSVGNSRPTMESYKAFRGQEPTTDALLIRRGLKTKID
ncbi:dipeptidyl carboxypeptidase II [Alishewanella sp. WH16-1]|jgi:peptidyl-dipeptidase Dcp|uniref:M3 family metallopeptidase n=1 Tax=Alishewanella sp. WH16-1 TaxID=1651088 RepID=UPI0007107D33|nr:M3 family metallopeptidase [Alishewanella sp. WH16-1]KRS22049.1 dipeptidyl carboxypeptidase II [Alishewanella sp. WH16-1]